MIIEKKRKMLTNDFLDYIEISLEDDKFPNILKEFRKPENKYKCRICQVNEADRLKSIGNYTISICSKCAPNFHDSIY